MSELVATLQFLLMYSSRSSWLWTGLYPEHPSLVGTRSFHPAHLPVKIVSGDDHGGNPIQNQAVHLISISPLLQNNTSAFVLFFRDIDQTFILWNVLTVVHLMHCDLIWLVLWHQKHRNGLCPSQGIGGINSDRLVRCCPPCFSSLLPFVIHKCILGMSIETVFF